MIALFLPTVPGSPPYGVAFESITPSEVNVTWQPPLVPNGVITHYSLELWNSTHYLNLTSPFNHLHITHLRKYAQYRVVVAAHTRLGPGNYSSEPLNITTLEDGEMMGGWGRGRNKMRGGLIFLFSSKLDLDLPLSLFFSAHINSFMPQV